MDFNIFEGMVCHGVPTVVICNGKVVVENGMVRMYCVVLIPRVLLMYMRVMTHKFYLVNTQYKQCRLVILLRERFIS